MKIEAVIFDVDGTLLDTERIHRDTWQAVTAEMGYSLSDELFLATRGRSPQESCAMFKQVLGEDFDYQAVREIRHAREEVIIAEQSPILKDGVAETLDYLERGGYRFAVASATELAITRLHLSQSGIDARFGAHVGGDMVSRGKPEPDIFLLAAKLLGVQPEHCAVIEDSSAGILAATRAGMLPIYIPDLAAPASETVAIAYRTLQSMKELPALLETYNAET